MFCSTINCGASLRIPVTHLLASSHIDGCEHSSRCTENARKTINVISCFPPTNAATVRSGYVTKPIVSDLKTGHFVWKTGCWQIHKHPNIDQSLEQSNKVIHKRSVTHQICKKRLWQMLLKRSATLTPDRFFRIWCISSLGLRCSRWFLERKTTARVKEAAALKELCCIGELWEELTDSVYPWFPHQTSCPSFSVCLQPWKRRRRPRRDSGQGSDRSPSECTPAQTHASIHKQNKESSASRVWGIGLTLFVCSGLGATTGGGASSSSSSSMSLILAEEGSVPFLTG